MLKSLLAPPQLIDVAAVVFVELVAVCAPLGMRPRSAAAVLLILDVTVILPEAGPLSTSSMPFPVETSWACTVPSLRLSILLITSPTVVQPTRLTLNW